MFETHIDYQIPINDLQKAAQYASFIARECRSHGIQINVQDGVNKGDIKCIMSIAMNLKFSYLKINAMETWWHPKFL